MASPIIEILLKIRDDASAVLKKVTEDVEALGGTSTGKVAADLNSVGKEAANIVAPLRNAVVAAQSLASAFAAFFAVSKVKQLADVAAQVQVTGTVLRVVANNAGLTSSSVVALDTEIQKLGITAKDSGQALTSFIQAGLAGVKGESLSKAKELARAAQDLAVISGESSSDTFKRLVTNIQQMDTMGLRFMGIMVNQVDAQDRYAKSVGKSAGELSEAEKKQAFMNATLIEATKLTGLYEEAMGDAAKQLTSIPRLINEIAAPVSQTLQPAYSALIVTFSEFLKEVKEVAVAWKDSTDGGTSLGKVVRSVSVTLKDSVVFILKHAEVIKVAVEAWLLFRATLVLTTVFSSVVAGLNAISSAIALYRAATVAGFAPTLALQAAMMGLGGIGAKVATGLASLSSMMVVVANTARASSAAFIASGGGVVGVLTAIRVAAIGLMTAIGPIGWAILAIGAAWAALSFSGSKNSDARQVEVDDNRKALQQMVDDTQTARAKMMESRRLMNIGSSDVETQKRLEAQAKEDEMEYKRQKTKQDSFAREKNMSKEMVAEIDARIAGELKIKQAIAEVTKATEDLRNSREKLGLIDKEGKNKDQAYNETLKQYDSVFSAARARMVQTAETAEQSMDRVIASGVETVNSLSEKAVKAGMSVEDYIAKFYPPSDLNSRWEGLQTALALGGETAKAAFADISEGFEKVLSDAKTPEQMAAALNEVGKYAEILGARVKAAKETIEFNKERAEVDRLNASLKGLTQYMGQLKSAMELYGQVSSDSQSQNRQWGDVISGLGVSFNSLGQHVASSSMSMKLFADNSRAIAESQAAGIGERLNAISASYQQEEAMAQQKNQRMRELASEQPGDAKQLADRMKAIDADSLAARLDNAKKHYSDLKGLYNDALSNFKAYAEKVRELDKQLFSAKEAKEKDLRELRRKGMTEDQQQADKLAEYQELLDKAKQAGAAKAYDKQREYANQAKDLAKSLEGIDPIKQAEMVEAAWDASIEATAKQKKEAEAAAEAQRKAMEDVKSALEAVAKQLSDMTKEQTVKLLVAINDESLKSAIDSVVKAFSDLTVKVKVSADTQSATGFAVGGLVDGPGTETSDSILAALSKNEFVTKAMSVRRYGADFFHALNNGSISVSLARSLLGGGLPKFAAGGMVGAIPFPVPMMASSSSGSVELSLTFNKRPIGRVTGARATVDNLVSALTELSRGS